MKIQRFEGVEGYGDKSLHMGGYSEKKQTYRNMKLLLLAVLSFCILAALQTTLLSHIPLFILHAGKPSLCLIFVLAIGYIFGEREGCVCGLIGGIFYECTVMEPFLGGLMIYPLIYCVLGYMSGAMVNGFLAGNLPSFTVYALIGSMIDVLIQMIMVIIQTHAFPSLPYFLHGLFPGIILNILFSPLLYLLVKAGKKFFDK